MSFVGALPKETLEQMAAVFPVDGYKALYNAVVFCKLRGNPYVELVHWLHQVMQTQDTDLHHIIKAFNIDAGQLVADTTPPVDARNSAL